MKPVDVVGKVVNSDPDKAIVKLSDERAEQEGIDQEEQAGTFEDVLPDWFCKMMELSKSVSVQSVDDLVDLSKITRGWYGPSQVDTAEDAQRWMYRLPRVYYGRLSGLCS